MSKSTRVASILTHDDTYPFGAIVPPIYQTSLFTFESFEDVRDLWADLETALGRV